MTRLLETSYETSFWAHTECWYLKEADIALLAPGNYDIDVTYNTFTNDQFFDILSAALFSNVDQGNPFFSFIEHTVNGANPATTSFNGQSITRQVREGCISQIYFVEITRVQLQRMEILIHLP